MKIFYLRQFVDSYPALFVAFMRLTYFCIGRIYFCAEIKRNPVSWLAVLFAMYIAVAHKLKLFLNNASFFTHFSPSGIFYFFSKLYSAASNWLPGVLLVAAFLRAFRNQILSLAIVTKGNNRNSYQTLFHILYAECGTSDVPH